MKGIKMSDCKFYVDEENRTVVCVIPSCTIDADGNKRYLTDMVLDFIREHGMFSDFIMYDAINFWRSTFSKELQMPTSFIGKAVCATEDEWNEEFGKLIAFSRAKNKCYKSFFKRANKFIQALDRRLGDMIEAFNDFGLRLEDKREALEDQINERLGIEDTEEDK